MSRPRRRGQKLENSRPVKRVLPLAFTLFLSYSRSPRPFRPFPLPPFPFPPLIPSFLSQFSSSPFPALSIFFDFPSPSLPFLPFPLHQSLPSPRLPHRLRAWRLLLSCSEFTLRPLTPCDYMDTHIHLFTTTPARRDPFENKKPKSINGK